MEMQRGGDAERVRRDLGETCHNDKPGCMRIWKPGKERSGSDGEEEVGRCG